MSLVVHVSVIVLTLMAAVATWWTERETVAQVSRQTGVSGWVGRGAVVLGIVWLYLPIFAGGSADDGVLWIVSTSFAVIGVGCCAVALSSIDEYRLLTAADYSAPESVTVGTEPSVTATTGSPAVSDDEDRVCTIHGTPSVYTDWVVQQRGWIGNRRNWKTVAGGLDQTPFTLGDGAVSVDGERYRVFRMAADNVTFDPNEPLPERVYEFFDSHATLPEPAARRKRFKILETYIPDDEPVTVVGTPRQGPRPGTVVFDAAPPDRVVTSVRSSPPESLSAGEPVLIRGTYSEATKRIKRRVYWLGIGGVILAVGGQALAFRLSSASLAAVI